MVHYHVLEIETGMRSVMIDITSDITEWLLDNNCQNGICLISSSHTTAGIIVNENADPDVRFDILTRLSTLAPSEDGYRHQEGNSDAHIKAIICGNSVSLPVQKGRLVLGIWQSVFFCEFDGPRNRSISIQFVGE